MFDKLKRKGFQVDALHHAEAILRHDMAPAIKDLESLLVGLKIPVEELVYKGGGEAPITQRLRNELCDTFGWKKHCFEIRKTIDSRESGMTTHEIDHVKCFEKGTFALEIEWNNKDPFFDRDLENFKRLHAEGAISIGAILTRGSSLQEGLRELIEQWAQRNQVDSLAKLAKYYKPTTRQEGLIEEAANARGSFWNGWAHTFVADKFGEATTHWRKLKERVDRGVGNPCPLLLIGIPKEAIVV